MSRPVTPINNAASSLSRSNSQRLVSGSSKPGSYLGTDATDQYSAAHKDSSPLQSSTAGGVSDGTSGLQRSGSQLSQSATAVPSRGGTLKKKASLKRTSSLNRSGSKRGSYAGSVRSLKLGDGEKYETTEEQNSAFYCPIPTTGSPTDLLADRFQGKAHY